MYRPSLLLPSDDYRGPLWDIGLVSSGFVLEYTAFWLIGVIAWALTTAKAPLQTWAVVVLPMVCFDVGVATTALVRLWNNYNWMLQSERRFRLVDILGLLGRLICCIVLSLFFLDMVPFTYVVGACGCWYCGMSIANCWAQSMFVWIRMVYLELMAFLLSLQIHLRRQAILPAPWAVVLWPLWFLVISILVVGCVMWYFARHDHGVEVDAVLRILIFGLLLMGTFYLLFVRLFTFWLDTGQVSILMWAVPLFLGQLMSLLYAVLIAIAYTAQRHLAEGVGSRRHDEARGPRGPPIVRNMRISLDKVGNNFYRLASGIGVGNGLHESSESTPLRASLLSSTTPSYYLPACSRPHTLGPPLPQPTEDKLSETTEEKAEDGVVAEPEEGDAEESFPADTTISIPPEKAVGTAKDDGETVEICIICCQNFPDSLFLHCGHGGMCFECAQTCFRRTGQCPTCRQAITGVAAFDKNESKAEGRLTAEIRDTK